MCSISPSQDYEPQGASVTLLIAEESMMSGLRPEESQEEDLAIINRREAVVGHLDKSHVTVHTYPEYHPDNAIATFRVDIDVATCGEGHAPLNTLDYLIGSFDSDIITMDYRVPWFYPGCQWPSKLFMDHGIASIQDYIDDETLLRV